MFWDTFLTLSFCPPPHSFLLPLPLLPHPPLCLLLLLQASLWPSLWPCLLLRLCLACICPTPSLLILLWVKSRRSRYDPSDPLTCCLADTKRTLNLLHGIRIECNLKRCGCWLFLHSFVIVLFISVCFRWRITLWGSRWRCARSSGGWLQFWVMTLTDADHSGPQDTVVSPNNTGSPTMMELQSFHVDAFGSDWVFLYLKCSEAPFGFNLHTTEMF